jgi:2-polyprenyl-6-methoxyphenol hydroxylase-like FAD-dependent oxidoreductase
VNPVPANISPPVSHVTPVYRFDRMANRWICYHRLRRCPAPLVAVGDAVCVFNRIYGQGLTVAAQQVQLLGELLEGTRTLTGLAQHFQRRTLAVSLPAVWQS